MGKLVPCEGSQQHALPIWKAEFYISKFIDNFDILFQTRVKYVAAESSPLVCTAHASLRADKLSAGFVVPLDVVHEVVRAFELPLAW